MRRLRKIVKWTGISIVCVLTAGVIYQLVGTLLDVRLSPPASEIVRVNDRSVHLTCLGEGPTTFVLDAGAGAGAYEWWRLQPLLAKAGRVCAFDRSGLGWSDSSGGAHDGSTAADELSALVRAAGIPVPFVYVGHSLGANFAIIYHSKYPRDVAALVLVEPGDPKDVLEDFRGTRREAMIAPECGLGCYAAAAAAYAGITRLAVRVATTGKHIITGRALDEYRAQLGRPQSILATAASIGALPKTAFEDMDVRSFGGTPVLTFASSTLREPEGNESAADVQKWREGQLAYLASLASMSTHGMGPVIIPDSTHASMVMGEHQSEAMAQTIISFLSSVPR